MKTKAIVIVSAMAGLLAGCATPAPQGCKKCMMGEKSDKVSCGAKGGCASKNGCCANGRYGKGN
jgi:hypothetical protein